MKLVGRARAVACIFLVAGFGATMSAAPAHAQKQGGTLTVGQELDIPGFDPLKVGVYDTSANTAAAAIFDTLMTLDDKGEPAPSSRCPGSMPRTSRPGPSSCGRASNSTTARRSMRRR